MSDGRVASYAVDTKVCVEAPNIDPFHRTLSMTRLSPRCELTWSARPSDRALLWLAT
jgi:hypothetical protein